MFCFKPSYAMPDGVPAEWSAEDVKQFMKYKGFEYKKALKGVDGKTLLAMDDLQLAQAVAAGQCDAIKNELAKLGPTASRQQEVAAPDQQVVAPDQQVVTPATDAFVDCPPVFDRLELTDRVTTDSHPQIEAPFALGIQHPYENDMSGLFEPAALPNISQDEVYKVFTAFASVGTRDVQTEMDGAKFMKLARECHLVDPRLKDTDVDIIFAKFKSQNKRRLTFDQFLAAIAACAEKKGATVQDVHGMIVSKGGPDMTDTTRPDSVRLHDDKSTYTGVYKKGGPTTVDDSRDLATLLDRSDVGKSARKAARPPTGPGSRRESLAGSTVSPMLPYSKSMVMSIRRQTMSSGGASDGVAPDLHGIYTSFANFGGGAAKGNKGDVEMTNARFVKLCKECGIIDDRFNNTSADIIFTRMKSKGAKHITFQEFKACLHEIAKEKHVDVAELENEIATSGGPMVNTAC